MSYEERLAKVTQRFDTLGIDAFLVTNLTNVRYLTGFSGTNGQVLVTGSGACFMSDPRYAARAADIVIGADVLIYSGRLTDALKDKLEGVKRLGFESNHVTVAGGHAFEQRLEGTEMTPVESLVEDLRRIKDEDEIGFIKEAIRLADETYSWELGRLEAGRTEREIALELEMRMREQGAEAVSFEPIVASGPLSAHIHHSPSDRALEQGDLVLMDFGCKSQGYCSDLTRTVVLGTATEEQKALYEVVLTAQQSSIDAVHAGTPTSDVDAAARALIEEAGHGDEFGHPVGHGVGLDVHESPRLGRSSEEALEAPALVAGDVVTIEPGIYVVGRGGVRIEDCVLVSEAGPEVLGSAPKDQLIEL